MKKLLVVAAAAALGACGYLADPIQSNLKADFNVPLFGGKTAPAKLDGVNVVQDFRTEVITSPGMPFHLPAADTTAWGPLIQADARLKAAGLPGAFSVKIESPQLTGEADIQVQISSKVGKVLGKKLGDPIVSPASCTMHLSATTSADDLQGKLTSCLSDWVSTNGVPVELDMLIGADLPPQGQGLSTDFSFTWFQTLHADNQVEMGCGPAEMPDAVQTDAKNITFSDMTLEGYGASTVDVNVFAFATAYDKNGDSKASAFMTQSIAGGDLYWIEQEVKTLPSDVTALNFTQAGTVHPTFTPAMPDFLTATVGALAGDGSGGGYGYACWMVNGAAPRDGFIWLDIAGKGAYGLTPDQL